MEHSSTAAPCQQSAPNKHPPKPRRQASKEASHQARQPKRTADAPVCVRRGTARPAARRPPSRRGTCNNESHSVSSNKTLKAPFEDTERRIIGHRASALQANQTGQRWRTRQHHLTTHTAKQQENADRGNYTEKLALGKPSQQTQKGSARSPAAGHGQEIAALHHMHLPSHEHAQRA